MLSTFCGVPRYMIRPVPGLTTASASLMDSDSLSRIICVLELLGTSTSSRTTTSAREPAICPVMPTDFTEGECDASWGATSKATLETRCVSLVGARWARGGNSIIILSVKVENSSERVLDAEIISISFWLSMRSSQHTNADVIHDLPTPRKASIRRRLGPCWR